MSSTKMNSKTHKIITAFYYPPSQHFLVPIDWDVKDINVKWDDIYYKGFIKKGIPSYIADDCEDEKYPETIEEADWREMVNYFSCCESEEEDESEEEEEQEKGCVKCGVEPRHNQTDEDGSYLCLKCEEEDECEERYCDNKDCPYEGYCYGEVKDEYEGKPYICVGCATGKGIQEQEQEMMYKEDK